MIPVQRSVIVVENLGNFSYIAELKKSKNLTVFAKVPSCKFFPTHQT